MQVYFNIWTQESPLTTDSPALHVIRSDTEGPLALSHLEFQTWETGITVQHIDCENINIKYRNFLIRYFKATVFVKLYILFNKTWRNNHGDAHSILGLTILWRQTAIKCNMVVNVQPCRKHYNEIIMTGIFLSVHSFVIWRKVVRFRQNSV